MERAGKMKNAEIVEEETSFVESPVPDPPELTRSDRARGNELQ